MTFLSRNPLSKSENRKICDIWANGFFIVRERMTNVLASNYDRKTDARPFETIQDILRCLSLVQSLLKGGNAQIWRIGNRRGKYISLHVQAS